MYADNRALMLNFLPIALFLLLGVQGCTDVRPSDITGTWILANDSRRYLLPAQQKAAAKIVLNADGTFTASDIPDDLLYDPTEFVNPPPQGWGGERPLPPPAGSSRLVTGSGFWRLDSREGGQWVQLDFHVITEGGRSGVPYGTGLYILRWWSKVSLVYWQGDPDNAPGIKYEKVKK